METKQIIHEDCRYIHRITIMEEIMANVDDIKFQIEHQIENQIGLLPLSFPLMDKSGAAVCEFYISTGQCDLGDLCPLRHTVGDQTVVCKHWLRGLCKKGDKCEFLHQFDMSKMPECWFFSKFNACTNKECPFIHVDPATRKKDCPWYDRGFCRHGPNCRHKHTKRVMCMNYLAGFCPAGPECRHAHPKFSDQLQTFNRPQQQQQQQQTQQHQHQNHHNQQPYHHQQHHNQQHHNQHQNHHYQQQHHNNNNNNQMLPQHHHQQQNPHQMQQQIPYHQQQQQHQQQSMLPQQPQQPLQIPVHMHMSGNNMNMGHMGPRFHRKPLGPVTCYKCGIQGHYANRCNTNTLRQQ